MKHPEWNKASGGCRRAALASYEPGRDTGATKETLPAQFWSSLSPLLHPGCFMATHQAFTSFASHTAQQQKIRDGSCYAQGRWMTPRESSAKATKESAPAPRQ